MAFLRVFSPDDSRTSPRDVPLDKESYSIGRERDNTVILEGQASSRHHARIRKALEGWIVEDLGSSHGTVIRGVRVSLQALRDGDSILLGDSRLEFHETPRVPETMAFLPGQDPARTVPPSAPALPPPPPSPAPQPPVPPVPPPVPAAVPSAPPPPIQPGPVPAAPRGGRGWIFALVGGGAILLLGGLAGAAYFMVPGSRAHGGRAQGPASETPGVAEPTTAPGSLGGATGPGSPGSAASGSIAVPPGVPSSPPPPPRPVVHDLVISEVRLVDTPQVGSMRVCILVECGGRRARFHVPREYPESSNLILPVHVRIRDVTPGDLVRVQVRLDDEEERVCGADAEDQTGVEFRAGQEGPHRFTPKGWILEVRAALVPAPQG